MGEKEMKPKLLIGLLLLSIVFISGCTIKIPPEPTDKPFIQSIKANPDSIRYNSNEKARIDFTVYNPLNFRFIGKMELRYDMTGCFFESLGQTLPKIEADSKIPSPYAIDLTVQTSYQDQKCIGVRTISVLLQDNTGRILDVKSSEIKIVPS